MHSGVTRSQRNASLARKLDQARSVAYGIQGRATVLVWRQGRQSWGMTSTRWPIPIPTKKSSSGLATPLTPEPENKALEVLFQEAHEKARLFEAVLSVLKKNYRVRVVNKPLGKSSRKSAPQD